MSSGKREITLRFLAEREMSILVAKCTVAQ